MWGSWWTSWTAVSPNGGKDNHNWAVLTRAQIASWGKLTVALYWVLARLYLADFAVLTCWHRKDIDKLAWIQWKTTKIITILCLSLSFPVQEICFWSWVSSWKGHQDGKRAGTAPCEERLREEGFLRLTTVKQWNRLPKEALTISVIKSFQYLPYVMSWAIWSDFIVDNS